MKKPKKKLAIPRMTKDQLREFVDGFVSGHIWTSADAVRMGLEKSLGSLFMPIGFGALSDYSKAEVKKIGIVYESTTRSKSVMALNGFPMFTSCQIMHIEDWKIAHAAAVAEVERRKNIPLPETP